MTHGREKSDSPIVPGKPTNKAGRPAAEPVEGRGGAEGNAARQSRHRTQSRASLSQALERVREAARLDGKRQFTALLHHVGVDLLRESYRALKRGAAPGVDGTTWQDYGRDLESNLRGLHDRIHRGAYRALPSRRCYIPKADGRQRPLGIVALEDKIVQRAVAAVLNRIYEEDFLGFSYGFRPGRGQHDALDALAVGITRGKVSWILDADIAGFFDSLGHDWLMRFVGHRIGDRRVLRLIRKWLKAGVLEDGRVTVPEAGTPQGAVISPLLANVYLHYVLDLWAQQWRQRHARGDVIIVRFTPMISWSVSSTGATRDAVPGGARGASQELCPVAAPGQDPAYRVRPLCRAAPKEAGAERSGALASRKPSPFWASRTSAPRPGAGSSSCAGKRSESG